MFAHKKFLSDIKAVFVFIDGYLNNLLKYNEKDYYALAEKLLTIPTNEGKLIYLIGLVCNKDVPSFKSLFKRREIIIVKLTFPFLKSVKLIPKK